MKGKKRKVRGGELVAWGGFQTHNISKWEISENTFEKYMSLFPS
jgi:hypothetical protein